MANQDHPAGAVMAGFVVEGRSTLYVHASISTSLPSITIGIYMLFPFHSHLEAHTAHAHKRLGGQG
jgi:hypothetical protein